MSDTTSAEELIRVDEAGGILTVLFNRPRKKNALTHAMYSRLVEVLRYAVDTAGVRVCCLRGAGNCFTSGNDLMDFISNPPVEGNSPVMQFLHGLVDFKKPLVAAVEGPAIGIGTTMLLHCDLVYASDTAVFQMPFTRLGLCPEAASSFLLPKIIGLARAGELLLQGRSIDAATAERWGLLTEVIEAKSFDALLEQRLATLAALPPEALRDTKALVRGPLSQAAHEAIEREAQRFARRLTSGEAAEAMQAFMERRPPDFSRFE